MTGIQGVRDQIRLAFPPAPYSGPVTPCDCDECTDFRNELAGKRWDEIPAAFLDFTCSPGLLAPEAFHEFLPAYLIRALDDLSGETNVLELTVYTLSPDERDEASRQRFESLRNWLPERVRLMNPPQIEAIRAFLLFVQQNAADADWFEPFITSALEKVWNYKLGFNWLGPGRLSIEE